jgi:hypothetical protein
MRATFLAAMFSLAGAAAVASADSVVCGDGTTSQSGRGACSHHGGVTKTPTERPPARTTSEAKPGKRAPSATRCIDGTLSKASGRGACSRHGGVLAGGPIPTGPEPSFGARCADGTISITSGRGACSYHGGIAKPAPRTEQSRLGEPMARCRDGSISYSAHRGGTCSRHGGVRDWLSS